MKPLNVVAHEALKDRDAAHPVPDAWRAIFRQVVKAFAAGDFSLTGAIPSVEPPSEGARKQMKAYLAHFGERLCDLPDATWEKSMAQWMDTHWEVLVDLWTAESGKSDLVLTARVFETDDGEYRFVVDAITVP